MCYVWFPVLYDFILSCCLDEQFPRLNRQARTHLANVSLKVASFQELNDCLHVFEWTSVKCSYINNLGYTLFEWMLH